jgi:hypothetical protein
MQKSVDTYASEEEVPIDFTLRQLENKNNSADEQHAAAAVAKSSAVDSEEIHIDTCIAENGMYVLPKEHPDYATLMKLQLENQVEWRGFKIVNNYVVLSIRRNSPTGSINCSHAYILSVPNACG